MKCYDALAAALVAEKVEVVFGLIGGEVAYLAQALVDQHKVRFVSVRHEEIAVGMADGYSRATGKVGVAIVCLGPGLTNACSPMVAARKANSKVLVICGGSPEERNGRLPGQPMHIDQPPLIAASIGAQRLCRTPKTLSEDVALTFRHLRMNHGPIALLFQEDLALLDAPDGWTYDPAGRAEVAVSVPVPRREDISDVAAMFKAARRPVILAGHGAFLADARPELTALADRTGSLLVTSLLAREWFVGDRFNLGVSGGFSTAEAADILKDADLVVAFGATLNNSTLRHGTLYPKAKFVQVDIDPAAINDLNRVDKGVIADARQMAQALSMAVKPISRPGWRDDAMARRIAGIDRWKDRDLTDRPGGANPRGVVDALDKGLPKNRLVLTDIGLFMGVPGAYMTVASPADLILPWQFGRMGGCLSVAMGAAVGRPDQTTVAFLGDGGFMASVHALETIKANNLPVVAVVMDDGGFGAERRAFIHHKQDDSTANYAVIDGPALAAALGIKGHRVRTAAEARRLAASGALARGPAIVQVIVDRESSPSEMVAAGWA